MNTIKAMLRSADESAAFVVSSLAGILMLLHAVFTTPWLYDALLELAQKFFKPTGS